MKSAAIRALGFSFSALFLIAAPAAFADVTETKVVSGTFVAGTDVTYTVVLTNNMAHTQPDNFGNEMVDMLPSGLTVVSASATSGTTLVNASGNFVTWNGSTAPGASVTITIVATISPSATGTISNQAFRYWDADDNGDNEQFGVSDDPAAGGSDDPTSFTVATGPAADFGVDIQHPTGFAGQGGRVRYTIVVTSSGPDTADASWTLPLPSQMYFFFVTEPGGWNCTNPAVTDDPSTAAANDATSFTVAEPMADLSLTMSYLPAVPGQNDQVTYTLVVTNSGPSAATNVVVTDDRPNDATFISVSATQGSCTTADPVVCTLGTLTNAASATITLVVRTPGSYTSLVNSATATSDVLDPTPATASATFNCTKSNGKPCRK